MKIETKRTVLRDFKENDFDFYYMLERDQATIKYEAESVPTRLELEERFDEIMTFTKNEKRQKYSFLVERKDESLPVGRVVLWQIDEAIDEWEIGWTIHVDHTRNGFASEASKALVEFGFNQLNANRICANSNHANTSSERVMQKIGMQKEGVLRATRKLNDVWYGSCIYSVLRNEVEGNPK